MPLMFAISIGATVSLVATSMFGLAWYEYEARVVLREQVLEIPTHDDAYNRARAEQDANLGDIDTAILSVVAEQVKDQPAADGEGGETN
ncbi:MAG: hypothetical protein AB8C95_06650 [Phycisphaeraceae bacterium]